VLRFSREMNSRTGGCEIVAGSNAVTVAIEDKNSTLPAPERIADLK
jgi:hypothetical protein